MCERFLTLPTRQARLLVKAAKELKSIHEKNDILSIFKFIGLLSH